MDRFRNSSFVRKLVNTASKVSATLHEVVEAIIPAVPPASVQLLFSEEDLEAVRAAAYAAGVRERERRKQMRKSEVIQSLPSVSAISYEGTFKTSEYSPPEQHSVSSESNSSATSNGSIMSLLSSEEQILSEDSSSSETEFPTSSKSALTLTSTISSSRPITSESTYNWEGFKSLATFESSASLVENSISVSSVSEVLNVSINWSDFHEEVKDSGVNPPHHNFALDTG